MASWCLTMQAEFKSENQEVIEWGIRRESPYERQRKAYQEMERVENGKQYCSSNSSTERSNSL